MVLRAALVYVAVSVMASPSPSIAAGGAPRRGGRFINSAGTRPLPGVAEMLPFFLRKARTSLFPRSTDVRRVPFDREAIMHNPSITWIGHATMLVRMDGVTFLTDPMFSERASPVPFVGPRRLLPPGVPLAQLPAIDFAILSHDHYDHTDLPSIAALAERGTRFIVPLGMAELVHSAGGEAIELDWWQHASAGRVRVHCVPAQHFSGRSVANNNRRLWAGWVFQGEMRRFYFAGDTGYFDGFAEIGERLGPIDLAALPIGAYQPASIMQFVHLNPAEAVQAGRDVRAARLVGMHFGTFDLTDEPLDEPARWLRAEATKHGLAPEHTWILDVGETRSW